MRSRTIESHTLVGVPLAEIDPVFSDPRSLVLWDRGVAEVEIHTPGPTRAGSRFDTISPTRGRRGGRRSSYEVLECTATRNRTRLIGSPVFEEAVWTFLLEDDGARTKVVCKIEFTLRRPYAFLGPIFERMTRAIDRDLHQFKEAIEQRYG